MPDASAYQPAAPELKIRVRSWLEIAVVAGASLLVAALCVLVGMGSVRMYLLERLAGEGTITFSIIAAIVLIAILIVLFRMRKWPMWIAVSEEQFRVGRVLGTESHAWDQMNSFEFHRQETRSRETIPIMVPIGVGTLVGYEDIGEKISISAWVTARHFDGRVLANFSPDYAFTRWLCEWKAAKYIESLGGSVIWETVTVSLGKSGKWNSLSVVEASFDRTKLNDEQLSHLIPAFEKMPALRTVDVSGTQVTDHGIRQLASLAHLEKIRARETSVSPQAIEATMREVEQRQAAGDFAFLGN